MNVLVLLSMTNTSSSFLTCARDGADLEADCWPGQIALNLSFVQFRDVVHMCRKALLWWCLLCPKCQSKQEVHIAWQAAIKKDFFSWAFTQIEGWFSWVDFLIHVLFP